MKTAMWNVTLSGLALCIIAVMWFPLWRIGAITSGNYNEGWNAYRQSMAGSGVPLYATAPALFTTNYPPLSFHLVGMFHNVLLAGRVIALMSLAALGALVCETVRVAGGSRRGGIFAGLCLVLWICTLTPDRRAMNDPELLSAAFAALGVLAYLRANGNWRWLILSAVAFTLGMFTKLDVVALPLSVGVLLLYERNGPALAAWVGAGVACAGILAALTLHVDGRYFFADLLQKRAYLVSIEHANAWYFCKRLGLVLVVCAIYASTRAFWAVLLLTSLALALYFAGGDGVDFNIFYPPLIAMAIICGLATVQRNIALLALALAVPALSGVLFVPRQLHRDLVDLRELPALEAATQRAVALVGGAKGPAICEDILICYESGKTPDYDPFYVNDQVATGRLAEADVIGLLASKHYAAIELDPNVEAPGPRHKRFSAAELRAIATAYTPVFRAGTIELWAPKP